MRIPELIQEAHKFDHELIEFKKAQQRALAAFVEENIPKADHVLFDEEALIWAKCGGSLAYLVGRREVQLHAGNTPTER